MDGCRRPVLPALGDGYVRDLILRALPDLAIARALGFLSRHRILSLATAAKALRRTTSLHDHPTLIVTRSFGRAHRVQLRLDLTQSGCVDLLLAPVDKLGDGSTASLLLALARGSDLVLDVGANVGLYTYLVAAMVPRVQVVSLEPVPALAALIADNVRRNRWESRVSVREEAVGAAPGRSVLYVMANADTEHTLSPDRVAGRKHVALGVPVVSIDDMVAASGPLAERMTIKIDVEGYESSVLDGMERTLERPGRRPDIIMEFLGRAIEQERVIERVIGHGLDVYYIGPSAMTRLRATGDLGPVHTLGYWNFLLTSRPPDEVSELSSRAGVPLRV
jgi:FkbM family methyltransferase